MGSFIYNNHFVGFKKKKGNKKSEYFFYSYPDPYKNETVPQHCLFVLCWVRKTRVGNPVEETGRDGSGVGHLPVRPSPVLCVLHAETVGRPMSHPPRSRIRYSQGNVTKQRKIFVLVEIVCVSRSSRTKVFIC